MSPNIIALITLALALPAAIAHAATTVQQLDWISGHWCSSGNGEKIEEIWLPAPVKTVWNLKFRSSSFLAANSTGNF
jgi:hypothetical protein